MDEKILMNKALIEDLLHFETVSLLSESEYAEYQKTGKVPAFKAVILQENMLTKLAGSVMFGIPAMLAKKAIDGAKNRIKDLDAMVSDLTSKTLNDSTISASKKEKIKLALNEYNVARKEAKKNTPSAIFTVFSEFVKFATICIAGLSLIALPTVLAKLSLFLSFGVAKLGFMAYNATNADSAGAVGATIMKTALGTVQSLGVNSSTAMEIGTNVASSVTGAMASANSVITELATNFAPELAQASMATAVASAKAFATMHTVGIGGLALSPVGMFIVGSGVALIVGYLIKKIWDYKSGKMTSDELNKSIEKLDAKALDLMKTAEAKDAELIKKGDTQLKEHIEFSFEDEVSLMEAEKLEEGNWALTKYKGGKTVVGGLTSLIFGGPVGLIAYLMYKKTAREQFVNKVKSYVGEKEGEELNGAITRYRDKANPADEAIIVKYQELLKSKLKNR